MKFFFVSNLTDRELKSGCAPWDFVLSETLTEQIRKDKQSRQEWYRNQATRHQFYTGIEPVNPNARPSKENEPKYLHAFCVDFDLPIPEARLQESLDAFKIKPAYVERSLGGNVRLVWTLAKPLVVDNFDFCVFVLQQAVKWLNLEFLPGLDEPAFTDPARLLCNGCNWRKVGEDIPETEAQSFYVRCGREYRHSPAESADIPLDIVENAIRAKFPDFNWPGEFVAESQGPTWWVPASVSPLSAIVKPGGMFTFSGNAEKPFYTWGDILGADFVREFSDKAISGATAGIFWDGKRFWRKISGIYVSLDSPELQNFFKVQCRMSAKPGKDGLSLIDKALDHIYNNGRISGAAPHLFRPPGVLEFQGRKVLNTYLHRIIAPADGPQVWGPEGNFPFLSAHLDNLFDPPEQRFAFLAWWKALYESAYYLRPMPGQNTFLMGGVGVGKTYTSRGLVGRSVGGFCDASSFLLGTESFNSHLLEMPIWACDDETMGESSQSHLIFQAMLKKTAANQSFSYNKKFEVGTMTEWMGRIIVTTNLDYVSSRALGSMDDNSMDKTNIFRCASVGKITFPNRHALHELAGKEIPFFLRWLLDFDPQTVGVRPDVRYGYKAHHEPTLLEQAQQGSKAAPFKELLFEALTDYFKQNPDAKVWRGSLTQLQRFIMFTGMNDSIMRTLRLEQTQRYLDIIQREGCIKCSVEPGPLNTRVWVFERFIDATILPPTQAINIFSR